MKSDLKPEELAQYKNTREYRTCFKIKVLLDLVSNNESDSYVSRKHSLPESSMRTMRKEMLIRYGYFRILEEMKKKQKPEKTLAEMEAENAELKKALELSVLKVAALETLIDVVDNELNIDIRKKGGSKQSK